MADRPEFTMSQTQMKEALEYFFNNIIYRPERGIKIVEVKQRNSYTDDFTVFTAEPQLTVEKEVISSGN